MPRILFVTGSLVHGGAEHHAISLMNRLTERGHECHLVYVKNDASQIERIRLSDKCSLRCLDAARYLDWRALTAFSTHLAQLKPDVIIARNSYALLYATLAKLLACVATPIVATFHSMKPPALKDQFKLAIERPGFWLATRTVFVCDRQRRYWLPRGVRSARNEVIYNGVDLAHFSDETDAGLRRTLRAAHGLSDDDYVIGISAVLRVEKNHVQLVDALAALRAQGIPAKLLIIGDGSLRQTIEAHARERGVTDHMRITGFCRDVRPQLAICDAVVLCSTTETFSLAALEAMAMGKPVVHAELGGAAEMIVDGHNGFLFPVGDTPALTQRLAALADRERAKRMGNNARSIVEANFSETRMVDCFERLLIDLCQPGIETPNPAPRGQTS